MGVYRELHEFITQHRACGTGDIDVEPVVADRRVMHRLRARCRCGEVLERSVAPNDAWYLLVMSGGSRTAN